LKYQKKFSTIEKSFNQEKKIASKCSYYKYEGYLVNIKELNKEEIKYSFFQKN